MPRCLGRTLAGEQCKRNVEDGVNFCHSHDGSSTYQTIEPGRRVGIPMPARRESLLGLMFEPRNNAHETYNVLRDIDEAGYKGSIAEDALNNAVYKAKAKQAGVSVEEFRLDAEIKKRMEFLEI